MDTDGWEKDWLGRSRTHSPDRTLVPPSRNGRNDPQPSGRDYGSATFPWASSFHPGLYATSHRWPSGSEKYPLYPPQSAFRGGLTIFAPTFFKWAKVWSTSRRLPRL